MNQTAGTVFQETKKAIEIIGKNISKLSESERTTLELLLDKEAQADLRASLEDTKNGNLVSWEQVKKELV